MAPNPHWQMRGQSHDFCELIVIDRGQQTITHGEAGRAGGDRSVTMAETGDVLLYPAGLPHDEVSNAANPVETICIAFKGNMGKALRRARDREGHARLMARWLLEAHYQDYPGIRGLRQAYLEAILQEFHRLAALPAEDASVARVRGHIQRHLCDSLTLSDLAEVAQMSRHHFCRRFKAITGRTPMEEVWRMRLTEARALVVGSPMTLTAIAEATGFSNPFHFSRKFRASFGMPPGSLRSTR
jgi:AraC-like DNA-binding protein